MKSNTKLQTLDVVLGYMDFLRNKGFILSLCNLDKIFRVCYDDLLMYMGHNTDFCLRIKQEKKPFCLERQEQLLKEVNDQNFGPFTCFAGVSEYVFPIVCEGERVGIICLAGSDKKEQGLVDKRLAKSIIAPLCFAFEKLVLEIKDEIKQKQELTAREKTYYEILEYITSNIGKQIKLKEICENTHYSQTYVSREFKRINGKSIIDYSLHLKIETAKRFLEKTKISVSDVAYKVGYNNPNDFTNIFKKKVGISPKTYRERFKN